MTQDQIFDMIAADFEDATEARYHAETLAACGPLVQDFDLLAARRDLEEAAGRPLTGSDEELDAMGLLARFRVARRVVLARAWRAGHQVYADVEHQVQLNLFGSEIFGGGETEPPPPENGQNIDDNKPDNA